MIYLESFKFNPDEGANTKMTCFSTFYPYGILNKHEISELEFNSITIFYGGNGCGKTTALNVIAEKLMLQRESLYNKSNFFDEYLKKCYYKGENIPRKSKIITSDDVFDYTMNLRYLNDGIERKRLDLYKEYEGVTTTVSFFIFHPTLPIRS